MTKSPVVIVAADWSMHADKRILCRGIWREGEYSISTPELVGDEGSFLRRMSVEAGGGSVLVGFDFPIGLPLSYADLARFDGFYAALQKVGQGKWKDWFQVSNSPSLYQPFYPRSATKRGEVNHKTLVDELGMTGWTDLSRVCERATSSRRAACPLFWTLGPSQVGRAACHGWQKVIIPALPRLKIWPFDGALHELLRDGSVVVAEIYPAEAYAQMGLLFGRGPNQGKGSQDARKNMAEIIEGWIRDKALPVSLDPVAKAALHSGFPTDDHFDAFVGILSMIETVCRADSDFEPVCNDIRQIEGWILGQKFDI